MATSNVTTTRTGTNWTIDVTVCNLDANLLIKDFVVLHAGASTPNSSYTKTTRTTLTYTGTALPASTTVEIRRKTPTAVVQPVTYASRFNSSLWNSELDRKTRWQEEADLNGVGALAGGSLPVPRNDVYDVGWSGDTVYPPTRNAVYNKIELLAPKAAPTFTGVITGVNYGAIGGTTANTTVLTHGDARASIDLKADLSSPVFSGTPNLGNAVAVTQTATDKSTLVATTKFVSDYLNSNRPECFSQTGTRSVASSGIQLIGNVWYAGRASGGLTTGASTSSKDYARVDANGWYKIGFKATEISSGTDYWFLYAEVQRFNGTAFISQKSLFKQYYATGRVANPVIYGATIIPIVWEAGADKIISVAFQHNNDANAARNWDFEMEIERISY